MADKGTLEAIEKLKAARPRRLLDEVTSGYGDVQKGVTLGLRFLVEDFRRQADLVMDSGARGKGAEATALRSTASALSLLADAVEKVTLDGTGEVLPEVSRGGPKLKAIWCGDQQDHGPHVWPVEPDAVERYDCTGHQQRDLSGLKALVADRSGSMTVVADLHATADGSFVSDPIPAQRVDGVQIIGPITMEPGAQTIVLDPPVTAAPGSTAIAFTFADPARVTDGSLASLAAAVSTPVRGRRDGELEAYLSGQTNVMPPIRNDRELIGPPHAHQDAPCTDACYRPTGIAAAVLDITEAESAAFAEPRVNTPELKEAAAAMSADPKAPPAAPVMPGRRLSWADARKAPTAPVPAHLSFSQGGTLDECGMQYRLQRLEPGVVSRPHWANVGGKALHAAAEWFEEAVANARGNAQFIRDRLSVAGGVAQIWADSFRDALVAQQLESPAVPPSDWKAGGRGQSEGWTWWQVEGEAMLGRYLDGRLAEIEGREGRGRTIAGTLDGAAMIELEGMLDVEGVAVKVVIDQVWRGEGFGLEPDSLVIDDLKSGAYAPKGSYQLGLYAWYLRQQQGYMESRIYGRFWDARKGAYSDPVDLLEAHPWDEIAIRVHDQQVKKTAQLFAPAPDWGKCGPCSVKHACPAALTRG